MMKQNAILILLKGRALAAVLGAVLILMLTGCAMFEHKAPAFSCPKVGIVAGADKTSLPGREAFFRGFTGACSVDQKQGTVSVELALNFAAKGQTEMTVPYFIAILSPEEEIIQRQDFSTSILADGGSTEEHVMTIPLASPEKAYQYKVAIGFSPTPEQMKHHKEHK